MPHLSVVIVSWNVRELLASCLRSLFATSSPSATLNDVWVVDNASTDGTPEMVADAYPTVRLIVSDENLGFAGGNNLALRDIVARPPAADGGSFIWLLNPDTTVRQGAAAALTNALEENPSVGVAGAKLLYPDGKLQHSAFKFPGLLQLAFDLFPLPQRFSESPVNGRYPERLYKGQRPFPIDHPLGASMMVREEVVAEVGYLDEAYHMYCEEIDWCWRMRKASWGAICVPSAEVVHYVGQSTSQAPLRSFVSLWTSRARLYAQHHGMLTWRLAQAIVRIGMRRRMRDADTQLADACVEILKVWKSIR